MSLSDDAKRQLKIVDSFANGLFCVMALVIVVAAMLFDIQYGLTALSAVIVFRSFYPKK